MLQRASYDVFPHNLHVHSIPGHQRSCLKDASQPTTIILLTGEIKLSNYLSNILNICTCF